MRSRRQTLRRLLVFAFFLALPVTLNYYSPYLMTQGTAERIATFSLAFWLAVFATSLVCGRAFCGWACPFNGLQQAAETVGYRPLRRVRFLPVVKYALWTAWAGAVVGVAISVGGWRGFDPLYMTEYGVSVSEAGNLVTYFALVGFTLAPLGLGRRGFCRNLCPFGVWGIVGEKLGHLARIPRLKLNADSGACSSCGTCTRNCPMQLDVESMVARGDMRETECFMCLTCADICPKKAIRVGFGRG
ncbi:MAG: 4Fe-4S binding protein [Coriobacteriales bacterium]|nr:4Fe-4S binding protein [Coriobacteriales bacterium]